MFVVVVVLSSFCSSSQASLLDAERYKEEFREVSEIIALLKRKSRDIQAEIDKTKEDLYKETTDNILSDTKEQACSSSTAT